MEQTETKGFVCCAQASKKAAASRQRNMPFTPSWFSQCLPGSDFARSHGQYFNIFISVLHLFYLKVRKERNQRKQKLHHRSMGHVLLHGAAKPDMLSAPNETQTAVHVVKLSPSNSHHWKYSLIQFASWGKRMLIPQQYFSFCSCKVFFTSFLALCGR